MRIKPKKSLGQNFLIDRNIQRKIISACGFSSSDTILEIGAGRGELTRFICENAKKVFAIEVDPDLYIELRKNLHDYKNVELINSDILKFDLKKYFGNLKISVIGNIPYYITSPIIIHLLKYRDMIKSVYLTVQKEFAERITARPGSKHYGSFSCFVQYYAEAKIMFIIKKTCFFPQPKVDSSFLRLNMKRRMALNREQEKLFFKIIRAAFNQRRKVLRNSLKGIISLKKLDIFFSKYSINNNIRPEDLSLEDLANLAKL